jgi:hypothetical protein
MITDSTIPWEYIYIDCENADGQECTGHSDRHTEDRPE